MLRRVERYFLREFLGAFLVGLVTAMLLVIALQFQQKATELAQAHAPLTRLFQDILYALPSVAEKALPIATALGASLAVNRMSRDNELTVLRGIGAPLLRLFLPFVALGLVFSGVGIWVANVLEPRATRAAESLPQFGGALRSDLEGSLSLRAGSWFIHFEQARRLGPSRRLLERITLVERVAAPQIVLAGQGTYDDVTGLWELKLVTRHRYDSSGAHVSEENLPQLTLPLKADLSQESRFWDLRAPDRYSSSELAVAAQSARARGDRQKAVELETGRWFKLAISTMCLIFTVCAPPLALKFSRAGSFAGVLLSVITVFVAWNTLLLMKSIALAGWAFAPPVVCAFTTHALFLLGGVALLRRAD